MKILVLRDQKAAAAVKEYQTGRRVPWAAQNREESKIVFFRKILQTILYFAVEFTKGNEPITIVNQPILKLELLELYDRLNGTISMNYHKGSLYRAFSEGYKLSVF